MGSGQLSLAIQSKISNITLENVALKVLSEGYRLMLIGKRYDLDWDEEQLSQELVISMKKSSLRTKHQLTIETERRLSNENELPVEHNHPKRLPRIDISIASWSFQKDTELKYFFEAKNLAASNWNKANGTKVDATALQKRYITTGIENFRTKRYFDGSLIGYVLNGDISTIVQKLNTRLKKDANTIQEIIYIKPPELYHSSHKHNTDTVSLNHIFLKFSINLVSSKESYI